MSQLTFARPDDLATLLQQPSTVLVDVRPAQAYWQGHLPGARHLDPGLLALGSTETTAVTRYQELLTWAFSSLGLTTAATVVVHGAQNDPATARAAWALRYAGLKTVLLDGGLAGVGSAIARTPDAVPHAAVRPDYTFEARLLESAQTLLDNAPAAGQLIDSRERARYDEGHIPGARHWDSALELQADGRFQEAATLRAAFEAVGLDPRARVTVYCGSGPRASRTYAALTLAGYADVAVYQPSWTEWSQRRLPTQSLASAA